MSVATKVINPTTTGLTGRTTRKADHSSMAADTVCLVTASTFLEGIILAFHMKNHVS